VGEPRLTGNLDLTVLTGFGQVSAYIEQLRFLDAINGHSSAACREEE